MSISQETEELIELYNQKISLDSKQLTQIDYVQSGYAIKTGPEESDKITIYGPSQAIEKYNPPIRKIDEKIAEINSNIQSLQYQILSLGQQANQAGCGSTLVPITVYKDVVRYQGYKFLPPNPFSPINGTLTNVSQGDEEIASATININGTISSISIDNQGKGYVSAPQVTILGPTIENAVAIASTGIGATVGIGTTVGIVTSITVVNAGYGYTESAIVTIQPPTNIGPGIGTTATAISYVSVGIVTGIEITNPGWGYTFTPTVTIDSPGLGITATASSTIDSKGYLTDISITNVGSNYITSPKIIVNSPANTVGFGTYVYVKQVYIGSYFGNIRNSRISLLYLLVPDSVCDPFQDQIDALTAQIEVLRQQRNALLPKSTFLKTARSQFELQEYGYNQSKNQINQAIDNNNTILEFLQDPANEEWL